MGRTLAAFALITALAFGQQTRNEVTRNDHPAEDARPNNPSVPDAYALETQFSRIAILRVKFKADLLTGIEQLVREQKIKNGVFLSALGSVRNYRVHVVNNRDFPSKDLFIQDRTAPADIIGMNGYIVGGRVHAHITLANGARAFGGHLESGTNVFTFAVITVGVLPDTLDIGKVDDKTYR
jgi:predicted DNA-binding protein with PD1-like motif